MEAWQEDELLGTAGQSMGARRICWAAAFVAAISATFPAARADEDERLQVRVGKIDEKFLKALGALAREYDKAKDPEAAHFFAECFLGFGGKDPAIMAIKGSYEIDVYVGKLRGGTVLRAVQPIRREMYEPAKEYKKVYDEILSPVSRVKAQKEGFPEARRRILHDVAVKYELARGAHEYVQAIQRFNELRRAMGLRGILWEFESSRKLILAGAYMGETGDFKSSGEKGKPVIEKSGSSFADEAVLFAKTESSRFPLAKLGSVADYICQTALCRQDMLNIDTRRLWLGHWSEGFAIDSIVLYRIPLSPYRAEIPTPSRRYASEPVAQDHPDWVDVENFFILGNKRVPYVRYPYEGDTGSPCEFREETGWADSEVKFLSTAGLPIMIRFFSAAEIEKGSGSLRDSSASEIPCNLYSSGDPRVDLDEGFPTIILVPERRLEPGQKYTVTVSCTLDGVPFEKTWSFTTRSGPARP